MSHFPPEAVIRSRYACAWLEIEHARRCSSIEDWVSRADRMATDRILHDERRRVSLLARGLLRYLYSRFSGSGPSGFGIRKSAGGCPAVVDEDGRLLAPASISHSRGVIAVAVTRAPAIGIDVEYCETQRDWQAIARRVFPVSVADELHTATDFYRAWCLYEAWGKANNLNHVRSGRNAGLFSLLEACFNRKESVPQIMMFNPVRDYQGCLFLGRCRSNEEDHNVE